MSHVHLIRSFATIKLSTNALSVSLEAETHASRASHLVRIQDRLKLAQIGPVLLQLPLHPSEHPPPTKEIVITKIRNVIWVLFEFRLDVACCEAEHADLDEAGRGAETAEVESCERGEPGEPHEGGHGVFKCGRHRIGVCSGDGGPWMGVWCDQA